jgi:hypothetical protein
MSWTVSGFDRRLAKLEYSRLGPRGYAGATRIIVHEGEDAEKIIREKIAAGEIGPDKLVIVRQIVRRPRLPN